MALWTCGDKVDVCGFNTTSAQKMSLAHKTFKGVHLRVSQTKFLHQSDSIPPMSESSIDRRCFAAGNNCEGIVFANFPVCLLASGAYLFAPLSALADVITGHLVDMNFSRGRSHSEYNPLGRQGSRVSP